jgi:hypothetical protein
MNKQKQNKKAVASQNGNSGRGTPIKVPQPIYQLPPEGVHIARCVGVVDIGTQRSTFGDGKKAPKVILIFELPNELAVFVEERGEEPFHQSIIYTNSLGERSNLYRDIVAWQGKGAVDKLRDDLGLLVGEPCMLNLIHETTKKGTTRSKVIGVTPLPKGMKVPAQISPSLTYSITDGVAGGRYDKLPGWIQKMILASEEIDGEHPSENEIAERNVRQATANAQEPRPHRPVGMSEPTSTDTINRELVAANGDDDGEPCPF